MNKPFSQACENNKRPILKVLEHFFTESGKVLEIGSGTGQHAVCFAQHLPHLVWQTSDLPDNHPGIRQWISEAGLTNLKLPFELDVSSDTWPVDGIDYVFSANTSHIMPWESVVKMFEGVGKWLTEGGRFALYGPFNYQGQFTSDSNAAFDRHLKEMEPHRGIRDFEAIQQQAGHNGLMLLEDVAMPANNRLLVWSKG
ncbi:methylase [Endozoicomonas montiporae]|uniref:Methylase n=2 Tax=Endozoicomonas montiporae TaxID=1027273 RepID=A0A081N1S0_9GAMM|nr:DUF938 domain-containing protein [Endozoicomonas montiporae]AMO58665.1 hypothetical protein EZMO1_4764 [Endozoicomonas montiporae CL-33]KEQ12393.1 methylase [Endozoicomonas montiporae]